jgi:hypothetical protein
MTIQSVSRCRLKRYEFPKYWEEIVENLASADQVLARIKEVYTNYQAKEGEGISFSLQDDQGDTFHVGCSDEGWVLMYDAKEGIGRIALGDRHARGHKPFLFPEWTDFERKHLIAPSLAETVVRLWIETGRLSDEVTWVE